MKKKSLVLAVALATCVTSFAFATPQTTFEQGQTQIDLGAWNPKASGDDWSSDRKWNFEGGMTYAFTDKLALQYQYYGLNTKANDEVPDLSGNENEVNLIYSLSKNFAVYGGWNRLHESWDTSYGDGSATNNVAQIGLIAKAPITNNFDIYAKGAVGGKSTALWEAGLGYTISKDLDINAGYRYVRTKYSGDSDDTAYKGFIVGLSYRFGGHTAAPAEAPVATPAPTPEQTYTPTPTPVATQKLDYYLDSIHFDTDIDTPKSDQGANLDRFVSTAKANPNNVFKLVGNTDSQGNAAYNQDLSRRRVENVEKYAENHGIPASQMKASYRGQTDPASTNETDQGRADNRRVDVYMNK